MTRQSKQGERRATSFRKRQKPSPKTGPKKDALPKGFKEHANAADENLQMFIPKIR